MNISEASRLWLEFVKEGREWCDFHGKKGNSVTIDWTRKTLCSAFPETKKATNFTWNFSLSSNQMPLNIQDAICPLDQSWSNGWCVNLTQPSSAQLSPTGQMGSSLTLPLPFLVTIYHSLQSLIIFHMYISVFFKFQCGIVFKTALSSISFVCQVEGNLILCSQTSVRFIFLGCDKTWPFNFTLLFWELAIQES